MKSGISDGDQMTLRAKAKLDKLIEEKKLTPTSLEETPTDGRCVATSRGPG